MNTRLRVGFVVQRCGKEVNGGAEAHCYSIANLMRNTWNVEVITTCARDYSSWENYYPEGLADVDGVPVRRFRVSRQRNIGSFNSLSAKLASDLPAVTLEEAELWMREQGPDSPELVHYIQEHQEKYDVFIFFTYLYATAYFTLPSVQSKSYLVPTAHDEWPIYLPIWDQWFTRPRGFIFNTPEEKSFLEKRFPHVEFSGEIVGVGVDIPQEYSADRFRESTNVQGPYILYIGRIDGNKGCQELFDYFLAFKNRNPSSLRLILIGQRYMSVPDHQDIISLGFVDNQTKHDAIAGAEFIVNPSPYESLSMILLEAWSLNKPALVSANSDVLVGQCKRSNGGLWYSNYEEFEACANYLMTNEGRIAHAASRFVRKNYTWTTIRRKYNHLMASIVASTCYSKPVLDEG